MAKSAKWLFENWACASSPSGFRGREKERERERERASERGRGGEGERERESAMVLASIQHRFNGH